MIFPTYNRHKESRPISYNSVYLIVACVKNFAATMTVKVLCLVQSSYEIYDYRLLFIVPISLLRKILKAFQN